MCVIYLPHIDIRVFLRQFCHLCKGLTNVKVYVEGKVFQKVKFNYKTTKYQVSVVKQV